MPGHTEHQSGIDRIAMRRFGRRMVRAKPPAFDPDQKRSGVAGKGIPVGAVSLRFVVLLVVLAGLLAHVGVRPAAAATFAEGDTVVVSSDGLNLRSDAGLDGTVRNVLADGTILNVLDGPTSDDGYVWYKVAIQGTEANSSTVGWVVEDWLGTHGGNSSNFETAKGVRVIDGPVNVRSTGGTDKAIVGTLQAGVEAPVDGGVAKMTTADGYEWIAIRFGNGILGWVATDFLSPLDYSPNLGSDDGWGSAVSVTVIDGPVNLREEPGTGSGILSTIPDGVQLLVNPGSELESADGYTWVQIKRSGAPMYGWLAIDFLRPSTEGLCEGACYPAELDPFYEADGVVVTDGPVNLRNAPGTSSEIVTTVAEGEYLVLESVLGPDPYEASGYLWAEVSIDGKTGFVAIDFVIPA